MHTSIERANAYANQGGHAYRKFQLACIHSGSSTVLQKEMNTQEYQNILRRLFCDDYPNALLSLNFVWAQAWDTAVGAGITEAEADQIYQKFFQKAAATRSIEILIQCHIDILVEFSEAVRNRKDHPRYSPLIQKVCLYVESNIYDALRVQEIADKLYTNSSYLSHLFKAETGVSLTSYIQIKKLEVAKLLLLQTDISVSGVMKQLGYISQSHFSNAFKNYIGVTPGQYKQKAKFGQLNNVALQSQPPFQSGKENWYLKVEEFGRKQGIELQNYHLACIRRGKSAPMLEYFRSSAYIEELSEMFEQNLDFAIETFIYLWPQAAHAASESGLDMKTATQMLYSYLSRLYLCQNVLEVLILNKDFFLDLADSVANIE